LSNLSFENINLCRVKNITCHSKIFFSSSSSFGIPVNSNFSLITNPGAVKIGYFCRYSGFSVTSIPVLLTFFLKHYNLSIQEWLELVSS